MDENLVRAKYLHPNRGQHLVIGGVEKINYGYRAGGDIFLVHKNDIASQPHLFQEVEPIQPGKPKPAHIPPSIVPETPPPMATPETAENIDTLLEELGSTDVEVSEVDTTEPEPIAVDVVPEFDFQTLPGVTSDIARQFKADGLKTVEDIVALGVKGLQKYTGIAKVRGEQISKAAKQIVKDQG